MTKARKQGCSHRDWSNSSAARGLAAWWLYPSAVLLLLAILTGSACNLDSGVGPYPTADLRLTAPAAHTSTRSITPVPEDVDRVEATIVGEDRYGVPRDPLVSANLSLIDGVWQVVIPDLPVGPQLEVTIAGYDAASREIYGGVASIMLSTEDNHITVPLHPVTDPQYSISFPVIRSVTRPAEVATGSRSPVTVVIRGSTEEELDVGFDSSRGSFDPPSRTVTTNANGSVSCTTDYLAPATRGLDANTVRVENSQGNSVETSFALDVISTVADATMATAFAPSVVSLSGRRSGDSVFWRVETADDGPIGELTFDWSFDQSAGGAGAGFVGDSNPEGELAGYDASVSGVVSLSVTDGDALTTTVSFELAVGQFPDLSILDAPSGENDSIAFVLYDGLVQDIWVVDADGRNAVQLTASPADETEPTWSPDGLSVAFISDHGDGEELFVVGADGGNERRLTSDGFTKADPTWSPDGSKLAYRADAGVYSTDYDIFVVNADGSDSWTVGESADDELEPAWSPDGSRIAFIRSWRTGTFPDTSYHSEIFIVNADGTGETQLTSDRGPQTLAWSPDGSRIAFDAGADGTSEVFVMDADGSNQTRLSYSEFNEYYPRWSPDGTRIACWSWDIDFEQPSHLWEKHISVIDENGENYRQITFGVTVLSEPVWSPDGTRIAFTGHPDPSDFQTPEAVYLVAADGSYRRVVTDGDASARDPDWAP